MSRIIDVKPTASDIAFGSYQMAISEHTPCRRCREWYNMGLSSTCPDCAEIIITKTQAYIKEASGK